MYEEAPDGWTKLMVYLGIAPACANNYRHQAA
jgi:hypothetical protein